MIELGFIVSLRRVTLDGTSEFEVVTMDGTSEFEVVPFLREIYVVLIFG